ncbi:unnamed protein product [Bemisia tabaci]|uniref:Uncharacterized protein n=1 Tax=Bemisia tabaci TaxID=7038 RepID=A0A9P0A9P0_BEMTA|nr:unnamed protein product [Bemisia tabaci]
MLDDKKFPHQCCPLYGALDTSLIPWPGLKFACVRILELYGKVFDQIQLCELIIRKTCNSCKCPRESHNVYHEEWVNVRERIGFKTPANGDRLPSKELCLNEGYSWIKQFFDCFPEHQVPCLGTPGDKYRDKQLVLQLPKQDLALTYCRHVEREHQQSFEDFINARNEIALDIGYAECPECHKSLTPGDVGVLAIKMGDDRLWHPNCFICHRCQAPLVDLAYCVHDDHLYCERHYAEQLKPRCAACDERKLFSEFVDRIDIILIILT